MLIQNIHMLTYDVLENLSMSKEEIVIDGRLFQEFRYLYEESFTTYPIHKTVYEAEQRISIQPVLEWIQKLQETYKKSFGLVVDYFPHHEYRLKKQLQSYPFSVVIGRLEYMDHCCLKNPTVLSILMKKYNLGFIYQHYYGLAEAMISSHLFHKVYIPDALPSDCLPKYGMETLVKRVCKDSIQYHVALLKRDNQQYPAIWVQMMEQYPCAFEIAEKEYHYN